MSNEGLPQISIPAGAADGMRVAVISATWNEEITDKLHAQSIAMARSLGAVVKDWRVPGALELPVVVAEAVKHFDAVVANGCVIEGETEHFRVVCDAVTYGLTRIPIDSGVPVGNGVLTVQNKQQALDRSGGQGAYEDKGADAALAAIHTAVLLRDVANS
ncbi:6,7-dimethyl-8-ribityllumazine synthase [Corynebacterium sp. 4HC-13]|uniref:6,7-dimethyl-8-ribityllumazine synthase n=1 Tax=Corynebacterium anserum TaxID=2684406 RepID=UPI00163B4A7C|nr:6,7-dimethyl-8-ribityllumazine synthase [Corynebacterium anserum]MBC2681606.1 6,7-dimethyl-8-ribityllumazine synthase [Corynebacterium anserum]